MSFSVMHVVIAKTWGGGEQYVFDICSAMKKKGIKSYVVIDESNIELQSRYKKVASVLTANLYSMACLTSIKKIVSWIRKYDIKILNCHSGHALLACMIIKKITYVKLVMFKHNALQSKHDVYHKFQRKFVDAFVCVSKLVYRLQADSLSTLEKEKFYMIYNGIDVSRFQKFKNKNLKNKTKYIIGYAGRIAHDKGIDLIVKSVAKLLKQHKDIYLYIAGSDEKGYADVLHSIIYSLGISDRVIFLGHVEDMERFYRSIDILISPSKVREAFGLVLCEAIYCGVPVIATSSGAQNEIIIDNDFGILIDELNIDNLIKAINCMYHSNGLSREIGEKYISTKFNIENTASEILKVYSFLLK